jgi:hypothetical protein
MPNLLPQTNGHSVAIQGNCIGCNGIKLRHIQINGARNGRPPIQGGGNIEFGGMFARGAHGTSLVLRTL